MSDRHYHLTHTTWDINTQCYHSDDAAYITRELAINHAPSGTHKRLSAEGHISRSGNCDYWQVTHCDLHRCEVRDV